MSERSSHAAPRLRPAGGRLVATSFIRSWRTHRFRAAATFASAVIGIMLATLVTGVISSILTAVEAGTGFDAVRADLVVGARSPAGMDTDLATAARTAATENGGAATAEVTFANTRIAGERDAVLSVIGLAGDATFVPDLASSRTATPRRSHLDDAPMLVVTDEWARRHGLTVGDGVRLSGPGGGDTWKVAATTDAHLPNDGAVALASQADVQRAFGRAGTDAVLVRVRDRADTAAVADRIRAAVGGAAIVGTADDVVQPEQSSFAAIRQLVAMVGAAGLLTAGTVLFVCWRLLVEDERETIGRLRLAGAAPRAIIAGSAMIFAAVLLASAAVAIPIGLFAAGAMTSFSRQVVSLTGLAAAPQPPAILLPAAAGLTAGLVISAFAWIAGLRSCLKVPAIEAVRGVPPRTPRSAPTFRLLALASALAVAAYVLTRTLPERLQGGALVVVVASAIAAAAALLPLAGAVIRRRGGFVRLGAGRELGGGVSVRPGMIAVLGVALILSIGLSGVAATTGDGLRSSVAAWTKGDLFVLPAEPGVNLRDEKFDPGVAPRLAALPSVDRVVPFTLAPLKFEGRNVQLYAWDTRGVDDLVDLQVHEGVAGHQLWSALARGDVAVSTNFAWLHDLDVGDRLTLPATDGTIAPRIVATVDDYTGDTGVIFTSFPTYTRITGDPRSYDLIVDVAPGATIAQARAEIATALSDYPGLTIWTGEQMRNHLMGLFGQVISIIQAMGLVSLALAVLVGLTTVIGALSGRARTFGLARLAGATRQVLGRQLLVEAVSVGTLAWLIGFPLGVLSVRIMVDAVGSASGTFPPVHVDWLIAGGMLFAAVAAALIAVWLPSRRLLRVDVARVVTDE